MRADRENLFRTVSYAEQHVLEERVMNPKIRARDVDVVVGEISVALQHAWQNKHQAGQE